MIEVAYGIAHGFAIGMGIVAFAVGMVVLTTPINNAVGALRRRLIIGIASLVCLGIFAGVPALAAVPSPNALGGALGLALTFAVTVAGFVPFRRFAHRIAGYHTPAID